MFQLIQLDQVPILEQLRLEEALLRTSDQNWCILSSGSPPAIVMGISGKPEQLIDLKRIQEDKIPVIKRFSGGGTVYIDPQTVFVTLILNADAAPVPLQPKPILEWSESLYKPLFPGFSLRENDYVFGERKFGGNAQYIQKKRWLLHTSFLWDYSIEKMDYLLLPQKRPEYRRDRPHSDFLCSLRTHFPKKEDLIEAFKNNLSLSLRAIPSSQKNALFHLKLPHRSSTELIY